MAEFTTTTGEVLYDDYGEARSLTEYAKNLGLPIQTFYSEVYNEYVLFEDGNPVKTGRNVEALGIWLDITAAIRMNQV